ncbi:MAG: DUF3857 domain-containing protein [Bacteroidota bacterium]
MTTEIPDTADVSGYYNILNDFQEHAEEEQSYVHGAVKVINDSGLSYASSWDWSYDPSYERMTFHSLYVIRGSQKIDHLQRKNFEIIQREENLSRASYDGSLSVIVNLKDVKTGDIVVYSYSKKGKNPVFKGHYFQMVFFKFGAPMGKISFRLVTDAKRPLQFKNVNNVPERKETSKGTLKIYSWEALNVPSFESEDRTPRWYSGNNRLQVTDFADWDEFSKWTVNLFNVNKVKSKALTKFIDSLKSISNHETQVLTAIKTIQDKVRYFSFVDGMSAYRPHDPAMVFGNKYGDCKDKSLLLSEILNEIGVESHPILVNTEYGKAMDERLPSPWNFDHCIVQYKYNDSVRYLDPTITWQRGSIDKIVTPDYYFGVVADAKQPGLTKIPTTKNSTVIRAKEDFEVLDIGGGAKLKVETYYTGSEADALRDGFKTRTKAEINKDYVDFYANEYPEIKIAKPVTYKDDTVNNALTVFEEYDIPKFWEYDSSKSLYIAETYARVISSYLVKPSTKSRHTPFTIRYPLDVQLITRIHVPDEWNVDDYTKEIVGPAFDFSARWGYSEKVIRLQFDLHNSEGFVEPSRSVEYVDKIDKVYDELAFQVSHPGDDEVLTTTSDKSTSSEDSRLLLLIPGLAVGLFFAARKLYDFDPRSRQLEERYNTIGGWLFLVAFGLTIGPFRQLYGFVSEWESHRAIFENTPFSSTKAYLLANLVTGLILITTASMAAILFWNRRTSTPYFFVAIYVLNLLSTLMHITVGMVLYDLPADRDNVRNLIVIIISGAIWIPYMLISERARGTFIVRLEKKF